MSSGEASAEALQAQLDTLAAERAALWAEVQDRRALEREVEELRGEIAYMESTASWRVTTPLRAGKRVVHRVKSLLAARRS